MSMFSNLMTSLADGAATQASLLDIIEPDRSVVPQAHFVEWFSGQVLDSVWTINNNGSGGSSNMVDTIGEGFNITTLAGLNDGLNINFSPFRQYNFDAAICFGIMRPVEQADGLTFLGFNNGEAGGTVTFAEVGKDGFNSAEFVLETQDNGGVITIVNTSISTDLDFHRHQIELLDTNALYTLDGILEATSTATLPTSKMSPEFRGVNRVAAVRSFRYKYLEAFNT